MSDVTRILSQIESGDPLAAEQLLPLVYDELRKLAGVRLAQEKPGQTLQATALVHDAYLRLVSAENVPAFEHRGHFFAAAAEAMRRILIDQARHKASLKMGGDKERIDIGNLEYAAAGPASDILDVDEALQKFEKHDPLKAKLVKLRFYGGLSIPEVADALSISTSTADRYWSYARAWLHRELSP